MTKFLIRVFFTHITIKYLHTKETLPPNDKRIISARRHLVGRYLFGTNHCFIVTPIVKNIDINIKKRTKNNRTDGLKGFLREIKSRFKKKDMY